jgi:hypothetical protein
LHDSSKESIRSFIKILNKVGMKIISLPVTYAWGEVFCHSIFFCLFLSLCNNPSRITVSNAFRKLTKHVKNVLPPSWVYFSISVFNTKWWSLVRFPLQNPNCSGFIIFLLNKIFPIDYLIFWQITCIDNSQWWYPYN